MNPKKIAKSSKLWNLFHQIFRDGSLQSYFTLIIVKFYSNIGQLMALSSYLLMPRLAKKVSEVVPALGRL